MLEKLNLEAVCENTGSSVCIRISTTNARVFIMILRTSIPSVRTVAWVSYIIKKLSTRLTSAGGISCGMRSMQVRYFSSIIPRCLRDNALQLGYSVNTTNKLNGKRHMISFLLKEHYSELRNGRSSIRWSPVKLQ